MALLQRLFLAAALTALLAGLLMTGLHAWKAYPLIRAAEIHETAAPIQSHTEQMVHDHGLGHDVAMAWSPEEGLERLTYTTLSNLLMAFGLSLVLCVFFHLFRVEDWRQGMLWGLGGFIALHLAPAIGLPPQLPGMPQAELIPRQVWWWGTALATAGGLILLARYPFRWFGAAGILMLVLPHLFGAPSPPILDNPIPSGLANRFAAASLATNAAYWTAMGALAARFMTVFAQPADESPAAANGRIG